MNLHKIFLTAVAVASVFVSGCAYRADLAQGNFVEQSAVSKLHAGMTGEQVRFVLGTPMLIDPFDSSRWYYVHYLREGWSDPKIENLVLLFSNGVLIDMQGDFKRPSTFGTPLDINTPGEDNVPVESTGDGLPQA